jgi:hypothetical protein
LSPQVFMHKNMSEFQAKISTLIFTTRTGPMARSSFLNDHHFPDVSLLFQFVSNKFCPWIQHTDFGSVTFVNMNVFAIRFCAFIFYFIRTAAPFTDLKNFVSARCISTPLFYRPASLPRNLCVRARMRAPLLCSNSFLFPSSSFLSNVPFSCLSMRVFLRTPSSYLNVILLGWTEIFCVFQMKTQSFFKYIYNI